jgi:hypothetical protein
MTHGADIKPALRAEAETHVGVIGSSLVLTPELRDKLERTLVLISRSSRGPLILHHGCGQGADTVTHQVVGKLGGWQIHGHPVSDAAGSSRNVRGIVNDLDAVHGSKPRAERDAEIVNACRILIAMPPYSGSDPRSSGTGAQMMVQMARAAGREIFYVPQPGPARIPRDRKAPPKRVTVTVATARKASPKKVTATSAMVTKDVAWAERQGKKDRPTKKWCGKYTRFLSVYSLPESELTSQMWTAYTKARKRTPTKVQQKIPVKGKRLAPPVSRFPSERRLVELRNLGAVAEVQTVGRRSRVVTFRVSGRIAEQFVQPGGLRTAAAYVTEFNKSVHVRRVNPPEAIRDAWR